MDIAAPAPMFWPVDVEETMPTAMKSYENELDHFFKRLNRYVILDQSLE